MGENAGGSGAFIPARLVNSDRGFLDEIVPRNLKAPRNAGAEAW